VNLEALHVHYLETEERKALISFHIFLIGAFIIEQKYFTFFQTNMPLNNHQIGLQHMGYQATSPNGGDGSNSTHNSPFTASPQGFDYPTTPPMKPSIPPK